MNTPSIDKAEEAINARIDILNKVTDCASYQAHLARPDTGRYIVGPSGTVEFIK